MNPLRLEIGPERIVLRDGLQPFLFQTRSGRLVVTAQMPVPPDAVFPGIWATVVSDDAGQSWRPWSQAGIDGGSPFHEGCVGQLGDGTILVFPWAAFGPQPGGYWVAKFWESGDDFRTLRGPIEARIHLPKAKGGFDDDGHPVPEVFLHRSLIPLPNDDLLMTAYGWFEGDDTPSTYRPSMNKFRTILLRSADRGRTWSLVSTVAVDPAVGEEGFNESGLVRLRHGPRAGRLIAHLRTGSNKTYRHNPIYQTESDDDGRTWTKPRPLAFGNVDPDLLEMADGTLVASFGWRTWESRRNLDSLEPREIGPQHGNYLAFSRDQGATWTQVTPVTHEPSTCYTAVRELEPGKLVQVYDIGDGWHRSWKGYPQIECAIACRTITVAKRES